MVPLILGTLIYLVLHNNCHTNKVLLLKNTTSRIHNNTTSRIHNKTINSSHNKNTALTHQLLIFKGLQIKQTPSTQPLDRNQSSPSHPRLTLHQVNLLMSSLRNWPKIILFATRQHNKMSKSNQKHLGTRPMSIVNSIM